MAGYCDQCDRHCPLDALRCGRGYRKYGNPNEGEPNIERMREDRSHAPERDSARGSDHRSRPERDHFDRPHREHHEHHSPDEPCYDRPEHGARDHTERRPHDRPHHERHEHGPHDEQHHGHHGHGPHHSHPGHGPSAAELQDRLETGDLSELMHMCGHVLHRRPEAGAARGQGKVLAILADEGTVSQKLLQDALHIQPGSMSEIVTKLENKGLLTRTRGEDRRGNVLTITEEGRKAAQKEDPSTEDLFSALSPEQQYQLHALLQTLLTDWLHRFDPRFSHRA